MTEHTSSVIEPSQTNGVTTPSPQLASCSCGWKPLVKYQRATYSQNIDTANTTIRHFPLELSNKDYMRRALQRIGEGLAPRVALLEQQFRESQRDVAWNKKDIDVVDVVDVERKFGSDIQQVLKRIQGRAPAAAAGLGGDVSSRSRQVQQRRQQMFADAVHCSREELLGLTSRLLKHRNALMHMAPEAGRLEALLDVFSVGERLLFLFGASDATLEHLRGLKKQFDYHLAFKGQRLMVAAAGGGGDGPSDEEESIRLKGEGKNSKDMFDCTEEDENKKGSRKRKSVSPSRHRRRRQHDEDEQNRPRSKL